jgi:beta-lactam-binding protein with PASTA domain
MTLHENLRRILYLSKTITLRALGGLALFLVFLVSAFAAMRLAIHGREVTVPQLENLSDADAEAAADKLGLHLSVENRFYAPTVAANHVLSQSPGAGSSVRRGWQIRVTESLGTQQVPVPDVTGQDEHAAELMLRRLQLEVGVKAHLPGPGPTGTILAQSPPPNTAGLDGPRVGVLVADEQDAPASVGYVMPSIVGLTVGAANSRLSIAGLHVALPSPSAEVEAEPATPFGMPQDAAIPATIVHAPSFSASAVITSQSPLPGRRVTRSDSIRVTVAQ